MVLDHMGAMLAEYCEVIPRLGVGYGWWLSFYLKLSDLVRRLNSKDLLWSVQALELGALFLGHNLSLTYYFLTFITREMIDVAK